MVLLVAAAHALTCEEIARMWDVRVPVSVIAETLRAGGPLPPGTPACLATRGLPVELVDLARQRPVAPAAPTPPAPVCPGDADLAGWYRVAVCRAGRGDHSGAIAAFVEVLHLVDAHRGTRVTRARAAQLDHDRELAILGIARVFYAAQAYAVAATWYDHLPRRSPLWARAQYEAAWADFIRDDVASARDRLARVLAVGPRAPDVLSLDLLVLFSRTRVDPCGRGPTQTPTYTVAEFDAAAAALGAELQPLRDLDPAAREALEQAEILRFEFGGLIDFDCYGYP